MNRFVFCCTLALAVVAGMANAGEIGTSARVSVIRTPNGGAPAEARLGPDRTIHLIYNSPKDLIPYYVKSSDGGASFSAALPLVETASRKPGLEFAATAIAVGQS